MDSAKKTPPIVIHKYLVNIYRNHTMDVSTVMWWVMHFSSVNSDNCDKSHSEQLSTQGKGLLKCVTNTGVYWKKYFESPSY